MVKVYKTGKNKKQIVLEVNEHKIALSNPSVQPHNEYIYNSPKDIMHFYYDIAIFEDTNHYNATRSEEEKQELIEEGENVNNVWKKKTETYVYEFGILPSIPEFIDSVLEFDNFSLILSNISIIFHRQYLLIYRHFQKSYYFLLTYFLFVDRNNLATNPPLFFH
jgi:hypothetical protein